MAIQLFLLYVYSVIALRNVGEDATYNHSDFYECDENSIEVIFVGGSFSYCTFSPIELYERYGISSYNFGTSNQYAISSYLWTLEASEYQDLKVVVLEAMTISMSHGNLGNDIRALSSMGISKNYLRLALTYKRNAYNVLFPVFVLHDEWEINENTFSASACAEESCLKGYVPLHSEAGSEYQDSILTGDETEDAYLKFTYVDKLREFCNENGIQLIIVKSLMASNESGSWSDGYHNRVAAYAEEYGIPFIDFNSQEYIDEIGFVIAEDVAEDLRHMNVNGAGKATDFIGEYLTNMEGLELNLYQNSQIDENVIALYYETISD